jgi:hypothetical protein
MTYDISTLFELLVVTSLVLFALVLGGVSIEDALKARRD